VGFVDDSFTDFVCGPLDPSTVAQSAEPQPAPRIALDLEEVSHRNGVAGKVATADAVGGISPSVGMENVNQVGLKLLEGLKVVI
jgi:hypothetical protein